MREFRKKVKEARKLLDFAIAEGMEVEEEIIKVINQTEESLRPSQNATPEQPVPVETHIDFEKAYKDLVASINPVTKDTLFYSFILMKYLRYGVIVLFVLLALIKKFNPTFLSIEFSYLQLFSSCVAILFFLWFVDIFTGVITKKRIIEIILFCYTFTIFSLSLMIFPVFVGMRDANLYENMREGPIGIVQGCSKQTNENWITEEIKCGDAGGEPSITQWVLNIGGAIDTKEGGIFEIRGGLIVPLYVVFISLIGGIVNMTRRVPEYQRRIHLKEDDGEYLSKERAREALVFQIMQVISAPLIAITVYYLIKPNNLTTSVVLSFGSGFASETVLLAISALVRRLNQAVAAVELGPAAAGAQANGQGAAASGSDVPSSQGSAGATAPQAPTKASPSAEA